MKLFIRYAVLSTICVLAGALAACGGGGSGGGGGMDYTIGGTISGLTASGLVLEDNGGDALTVQANSSTFQFSTAIVNGSSYSVSVSSNPTGETCTVASNGSGKVDGANVTNVAVSCKGGGTNYTLGGTVSGLTGSGLVLENNGGDALAVQSSSGTFQFSTAIANGSSYSVSVSSNPTGETCAVASNGSGKVDGANVTNVAVSCSFSSGSNVAAITVVNAVSGVSALSFNDLLTSVQVCVPGGACATIPNILVDTGSSGLRLFKSQLGNVSCNGGIGLCPTADPANAANTLAECFEFADGYTYGWVSTADVKIGSASANGETASSIPVQIIDDSLTAAQVPNACSGKGGSGQTISSLAAYGILGIGQFVQDCGAACVNSSSPDIYFSCSGGDGGSCSPITMALADQVSNPVASFATDNNGVIVQLPPIASTGAATAAGSLVFGIGTESNNGLGSATILTTSAQGYFTTSFNNGTINGFIDSGSNALFFPDSSLSTCADATQFYCPGSASSLSATSLSATNQGGNGSMSNVSFQVVNLDYLAANDGSDYALDDVGGPASGLIGLANSSFFDWGIPFFYGRTIYVAIDGKTAGSATGPYFAY